MCIYNILGWCIIMIPFLLLYILIGLADSFKVANKVFILTFIAVGFCFLAGYLITYKC